MFQVAIEAKPSSVPAPPEEMLAPDGRRLEDLIPGKDDALIRKLLEQEAKNQPQQDQAPRATQEAAVKPANKKLVVKMQKPRVSSAMPKHRGGPREQEEEYPVQSPPPPRFETSSPPLPVVAKLLAEGKNPGEDYNSDDEDMNATTPSFGATPKRRDVPVKKSAPEPDEDLANLTPGKDDAFMRELLMKEAKAPKEEAQVMRFQPHPPTTKKPLKVRMTKRLAAQAEKNAKNRAPKVDNPVLEMKRKMIDHLLPWRKKKNQKKAQKAPVYEEEYMDEPEQDDPEQYEPEQYEPEQYEPEQYEPEQYDDYEESTEQMQREEPYYAESTGANRWEEREDENQADEYNYEEFRAPTPSSGAIPKRREEPRVTSKPPLPPASKNTLKAVRMTKRLAAQIAANAQKREPPVQDHVREHRRSVMDSMLPWRKNKSQKKAQRDMEPIYEEEYMEEPHEQYEEIPPENPEQMQPEEPYYAEEEGDESFYGAPEQTENIEMRTEMLMRDEERPREYADAFPPQHKFGIMSPVLPPIPSRLNNTQDHSADFELPPPRRFGVLSPPLPPIPSRLNNTQDYSADYQLPPPRRFGVLSPVLPPIPSRLDIADKEEAAKLPQKEQETKRDGTTKGKDTSSKKDGATETKDTENKKDNETEELPPEVLNFLKSLPSGTSVSVTSSGLSINKSGSTASAPEVKEKKLSKFYHPIAYAKSLIKTKSGKEFKGSIPTLACPPKAKSAENSSDREPATENDTAAAVPPSEAKDKKAAKKQPQAAAAAAPKGKVSPSGKQNNRKVQPDKKSARVGTAKPNRHEGPAASRQVEKKSPTQSPPPRHVTSRRPVAPRDNAFVIKVPNPNMMVSRLNDNSQQETEGKTRVRWFYQGKADNNVGYKIKQITPSEYKRRKARLGERYDRVPRGMSVQTTEDGGIDIFQDDTERNERPVLDSREPLEIIDTVTENTTVRKVVQNGNKYIGLVHEVPKNEKMNFTFQDCPKALQYEAKGRAVREPPQAAAAAPQVQSPRLRLETSSPPLVRGRSLLSGIQSNRAVQSDEQSARAEFEAKAARTRERLNLPSVNVARDMVARRSSPEWAQRRTPDWARCPSPPAWNSSSRVAGKINDLPGKKSTYTAKSRIDTGRKRKDEDKSGKGGKNTKDGSGSASGSGFLPKI